MFSVVLLTLFLSSFAGAATNTLDNLLDFFPSSQGDGLNIIWAHGVNSHEELDESLSDDTMMLETDIILRGIGTENQTDIPVNAHPPATDSDLLVLDFVNETTLTSGKGMKLDFKYLEAVGPTMEIVLNLTDQIKCPLWINADIVKGPNSPKDPISPVEFIETANSYFDQTVMSLGFTTGWGPLQTEDLYTWTMIFDILQYTYPLDPQPVTYPIRAIWCVRSWSKFTWLLGLRDSFSITVWSGSSDPVNVQGLVSLRSHGDMARIYYDLPDTLRDRFLEAIEDGTPEPDVKPPSDWQSDRWQSFNADQNNFVFLSTESAGISGGRDRSGYIQSKEEFTAERGVTNVNVHGTVQFVNRYDEASNDARFDVYIRSDEINPDDSDIYEEWYSINGVRLQVGRDGEVFLGGDQDAGGIMILNCKLPSAECYSFEIVDKGENGPIESTVTVVSCSDALEPDENDGRNCSLSLTTDELLNLSNQSFVIVFKNDGSADVIIENLAVFNSEAEDPGRGQGIMYTISVLLLSILGSIFGTQ